MNPLLKSVSALVLVGALSACSHSGSNPPLNPPPPAADLTSEEGIGSFQAALEGATEPTETYETQRKRAEDFASFSSSDGRLSSSLSYLLTDGDQSLDGRDFLLGKCNDKGTCNVLGFITNRGVVSIAAPAAEINLGDLDPENAAAGQALLTTENGITLLETVNGYVGPDHRLYGSWMDHRAFAVAIGIEPEYRNGVTSSVEAESILAIANGGETGTRPAATATWTGVMVGASTAPAFYGDRLVGDAKLTFDAMEGQIDATFDNIVNVDNDEHTIPEIVVAAPVTPEGTWGTIDLASRAISINGAFGGDNHEEVSGTVVRLNIDVRNNGVVAAYGAKKDDATMDATMNGGQ
ncbi:MAG: hypothetical protein GDA49_00320 [Rhodospirillales bacterium]|nr:hypothetical protein [Rhodospirillales bacterium]